MSGGREEDEWRKGGEWREGGRRVEEGNSSVSIVE